MVKKERSIRARIQQKQQSPCPEPRQMNRDDGQFGHGYFVWRLWQCLQRDVPSFHACLHHFCVVETKNPVRVVHQHVEMPQKIPSDNASNLEIGCTQRLQVLHHNGMVGNRMRARFQQPQIRKGSIRTETHTDDLSRASDLQVKFGCQQWIHDRGRGACIHQKVIGAGMVNDHRHNYSRTLYEVEG